MMRSLTDPEAIQADGTLGKTLVRHDTFLCHSVYDDNVCFSMLYAYADMQYKCIEAILKTGITFDFGHFWEDVCFKNGPLLSPESFESLCAKHYKKRTDLCLKYGIDIISLDCDGVTEKLLPTWVNNGINTMFPIEVGVWGDQFAPAGERFGKRILGVGGMDKTAFRKDKAAVDAEIRLCACAVLCRRNKEDQGLTKGVSS